MNDPLILEEAEAERLRQAQALVQQFGAQLEELPQLRSVEELPQVLSQVLAMQRALNEPDAM